MSHLLVTQLCFSRAEFVRCLEGVTARDGVRRLEPMNCISWIVGHLASQENFYWVEIAQRERLAPGLHMLVGYGQPPSTPSLDEMWTVWGEVTEAADRYVDTVPPELLRTHLQWQGKPRVESVGTMLLRNIYHYWKYLGEAHAIRQMLGHSDLPQFVGDMPEALGRLEH